MGSTTQSVIILAAMALIVLRFAMRELRERVVRASTLWIRPVLLLALSLYLVVTAFRVAVALRPVLVVVVAVAAVIGAVAGALVVRMTSFSPADRPRAVRAEGSARTLAVWIAVLVLRLAARWLVPARGIRAQLVLDSGTVVLVAAAFTVIALAFFAAIRRTAPLAPATRS